MQISVNKECPRSQTMSSVQSKHGQDHLNVLHQILFSMKTLSCYSVEASQSQTGRKECVKSHCLSEKAK